MALTKQDIKQIGEVVETKVTKVVEPYFNAIQKDFTNVYARFDRIESLIQDDYKQRIEKLEGKVQKLEDLLAIK